MLEAKTDYEDCSFKGLTITDKDLSRTRFDTVLFKQCHFDKVHWKDSSWHDCTFIQCSFSLLNLERSYLQNSFFQECKLVGINFSSLGKCSGLSFDQSVLHTCTFTNMKLPKIVFKGTKIRECHFIDTDLTQANFCDTDLKGTLFHHADLSGADFRGAVDYFIDVQSNKIKKAQFSLPEAMTLLEALGIVLS